jgi:hypothetical protein
MALALTLPVLAGACGGERREEATAGAPDAFVVVSNRGGAWRLYETAGAGGGARLVGSPRADDASYADGQPARLPDGTIVFTSDRGGRAALYLCDRGREEARPVFGAAAAGGGADAPAGDAGSGSPDSDPAPCGADRIVFARIAPAESDPGAVADGARDLFLVRRDGSGLRRLTGDPADDGAPCALSDGHSIVFASARQGERRLFRLDADAPDPERTVTPLFNAVTGTSDDAPACLADGSILFARSAPGAPSQVFQARFTDRGPAARQLSDTATLPYGAGEPVPLGDGRILMTAGPGPANGGPRFAVYGISGGGYNLARVTRERAGYEDLTRRLRPSR